MKVVVDTNILFSYFWKNSLTKKLLEMSKIDLVSPSISLKEIKKYKEEISDKAKINPSEFLTLLNNLKKTVKFIEKSYYSSHLDEAQNISPDEADADFFALCLKEKTFLWSNDSLLQKQNKINVLSTKEIIELLLD